MAATFTQLLRPGNENFEIFLEFSDEIAERDEGTELVFEKKLN